MKQSLNNQKKIRRIDAANMLGLIADLPDQFRQGIEQGRRMRLSIPRNTDQIVFVGLGGSAISGDLVQALLSTCSKIPIKVYRTYDLPPSVTKKSLVIASSYSGDTEETLSAFAVARKRGAKAVVVTSGGKLGGLAYRAKLSWGIVPSGLPPRTALGFLTGIPLGWLSSNWPQIALSKTQLAQAVGTLELAERQWGPSVPTQRNLAKQLANQLWNRLPVLYGADGGWEVVVSRWRAQLAENAKVLASSHLFPEMNHNEINAWRFPPKVLRQTTALFLKDRAYHPRVLRRMEITAKVIRKSGAPVFPVEVKGANRAGRLLSMIALGDYVSVYLSVLNNVDPTPVEVITYLKGQLARS